MRRGSTYLLLQIVLPCNRGDCDIPVSTSEIVHVGVREVFFPRPATPAETARGKRHQRCLGNLYVYGFPIALESQ